MDTIPQLQYQIHIEILITSGNLKETIVLVNLYGVGENQEIHTCIFNMEIQSPFGSIFFSAIIVGALTLTVVYIYVPQVFKKSKV